MKTISIFLALVNSLLAGLLIMFSLSSSEIQQAESWWLLTKLLAGMSVIVIGVLTWVGSVGYVKSSLVALASVYLVALGAATVVWTFHLAQVRGDMEYYMIIYGGTQGCFAKTMRQRDIALRWKVTKPVTQQPLLIWEGREARRRRRGDRFFPAPHETIQRPAR